MKLKWKVQSAPTGRYRSFERRGWPEAAYETGKPAAWVQCEDDYVPANAKSGNHGELKVLIADWTCEGNGFKWRTLTKRAKTLDEAKTLALQFLEAHPEYWPETNNK